MPCIHAKEREEESTVFCVPGKQPKIWLCVQMPNSRENGISPPSEPPAQIQT